MLGKNGTPDEVCYVLILACENNLKIVGMSDFGLPYKAFVTLH